MIEDDEKSLEWWIAELKKMDLSRADLANYLMEYVSFPIYAWHLIPAISDRFAKADWLIAEFKKIDSKTGFAKSDLETGMLAETGNGNIYLVVNSDLVRKKGYMSLSHYNNNLKLSDEGEDYDIVKVSKVLGGVFLRPEFWTKKTLSKNLLWEREPVETIEIGGIKYNKEEVKNSLKNLKPVR